MWGVGLTKDNALADALSACVDYQGNDINTAGDLEIALTTGDLALVPCTEMLFDQVVEDGGEVEFVFIDLVGAMLPKEKVLFE